MNQGQAQKQLFLEEGTRIKHADRAVPRMVFAGIFFFFFFFLVFPPLYALAIALPSPGLALSFLLSHQSRTFFQRPFPVGGYSAPT
jgi:hypothetical protein